MNEDEKRGKFLVELRIKNNLKQSDLAKMINYSDKSISKWERGVCFPKKTEVLIKLAEIFNVSIDELLKGEYIDNNKNKFKKFFNTYCFYISIIIILILLIIIIYIYLYIGDFDSINNLVLNGGSNIIMASNYNDVFDYTEDNFEKKFSNQTLSSDSRNIYNESVNNNVLLNYGFNYENFIFYKELNDKVNIYYHVYNNSFKVYGYDEFYFYIYGFAKSDNISIDIINNNFLNKINFTSKMEKNCDVEVCNDYFDYAMYINYLKNLLIS